jgi:hypothetical protein
MKTAIVYKEGKAFLIESMPEEPKPENYFTTDAPVEQWSERDKEGYDQYGKDLFVTFEQALEAAKANAIEIAQECQELVKQLVEQSVRGVPMTGVSYIVEGIEFEVKQLKGERVTEAYFSERHPGEYWCDECCNGDRCDDKTHIDRKSCPYCKGTGFRPFNQLAIIRLSNSEVGKEETEKESQTKRAILELIETDIGVYKLSLAGARAINDELEKRYRMGQIHALEMLRFEIINANAEASRKNPLT